jgi:L-rhamnose mutarotase
MIRKASVMKLLPGCQEEYKKRHDELWPEMETELKNHGAIIIRYSWMKSRITYLLT